MLLFPHITVWGSCFSLGSRPGSLLRLRLRLRRLLFIFTHHSRPPSLPPSLLHSLTHSLTHSLAQYTEPPHFPFAWHAQYTWLPGGAAARWPPLARGCLLPGTRSTQSLRTSFVCGCRRSTQSFLEELRRGFCYALLCCVLFCDLPPFIKVNSIASYFLFCIVRSCTTLRHFKSQNSICPLYTTLHQGQFHCFLFYMYC